MNEALGRNQFGFIARQTVATQDMRKAIYANPLGLGYHEVTNPYSTEKFVVSDLTGGSTFEPGSVVMLASYSGQHGEGIIGRAPAGFGGSGVSRTTLPPEMEPSYTPPEPGPDDGLDLHGFCWDDGNQRAIIARVRTTADPTYALEFVKIDRDQIPHADKALGTAFASISLTSGEATALRVYAMQIGDSAAFYVFFYLGEVGSVADTALMHLARISNAGDVTEHITYDFPDVATFGLIGTAFFGSKLYACEFIESASELTGGNPFENDQRLTQRHPTTLVVLNEFDVPDPSTYDGWTLAGSAVRAIVEDSGTLRAFYEYQQVATGDYKFFYQDFNSSMALSGAAVAMAGNPYSSGDPAMGVLNNVQVSPGGGIRWVESADLYSATIAGSSRTLITSGYNTDSQNFNGIAQISSTETLILGSGNDFSTSILTAAGQQLPTP